VTSGEEQAAKIQDIVATVANSVPDGDEEGERQSSKVRIIPWKEIVGRGRRKDSRGEHARKDNKTTASQAEELGPKIWNLVDEGLVGNRESSAEMLKWELLTTRWGPSAEYN